VAGVLLVLATGVLTRSAPPAPTPIPAGAFAFAVLGDAPYYMWEDLQFRLVLKALDAHELRSVVHVGDMFWRPCTDAYYRRSLEWFNGLRHPVIYTPGDNEWFDCWEPGSGRFAPQDRLDRIRKIFFSNPARSLGQRPRTLVSQGGRGSFPEFVENVRWVEETFVFATVHLIGSMNGMRPFPGRDASEDVAAKRRTEAAASWVRETFAEAVASNAPGVVLAFHASPDFDERPPASRNRAVFEPFLAALEEEVERFPNPVLAMHGDDHIYIVDRPLVRRGTGRRLENLVRVQVPGSPEVGWVRVTVNPAAADPFTFENHVLPRWKYW
jgi:hypothetical protein